MVSRRLGLAGAMSALFLLTYPALAEDGHTGFGSALRGDRPHHGQHRGEHHRRHGGHHVTIGGGYGVPSIIPHVGTYAGTISALHVRGIGTYYYAEGFGPPAGADQGNTVPVDSAPASKMIDVNKRKNPCSFEGGVCVIRP